MKYVRRARYYSDITPGITRREDVYMNPYIKLLRMKTWYAFFLLIFLGFILSEGFITQLLDILIFVLMISVFVGFSFAINDSFDVEEDRVKESRKNPVANGEISARRAKVFSLSLVLLGLLLSLWFSLIVFIYFTCLTFLSLFYSVPPLRFKSRFPLDILSHGLFFGSLILILPALVFGSFTIQLLLVSVSIFFLSVIIELWNHIIDFKSDTKARLRTTVCVIGLKRSERIAKILALLFPLTLLPLYLNGVYFLLFIVVTSIYSMIFLKSIGPTLLYSSEATILYLYANLPYGIILVSKIIGISL